MKLALGTAQFGSNYGITNAVGCVPLDEVSSILQFCQNNGIDMLDTAIAYGFSERRLGRLGVSSYKIITKLPPLPSEVEDVGDWVENQVRQSLERLKVNEIYGLLLHQSKDLLGDSSEELLRSVKNLKLAGLINKFGISIYSPNELNCIKKIETIDIVQAPYNLIDRRLLTSGWLQRLHDLGIEVHARSIFLQGLLLLHPDNIPKKFSSWVHIFRDWHRWLIYRGLEATEVCAAFVYSDPRVDRVVIGVDNCQQLQSIFYALNPPLLKNFPEIYCEDEKLINPSNWNWL